MRTLENSNKCVLRGGTKDSNAGCCCTEKKNKKDCPIPGNRKAESEIYDALVESETTDF